MQDLKSNLRKLLAGTIRSAAAAAAVIAAAAIADAIIPSAAGEQNLANNHSPQILLFVPNHAHATHWTNTDDCPDGKSQINRPNSSDHYLNKDEAGTPCVKTDRIELHEWCYDNGMGISDIDAGSNYDAGRCWMGQSSCTSSVFTTCETPGASPETSANQRLCREAGYAEQLSDVTSATSATRRWLCNLKTENGGACKYKSRNHPAAALVEYDLPRHVCGCVEGRRDGGVHGSFDAAQVPGICGCNPDFQSWYKLPGKPFACVANGFLDKWKAIFNRCTGRGHQLRSDGEDYYCVLPVRNNYQGRRVYPECLITGPSESEVFNPCSAAFGTPANFPYHRRTSGYTYCPPGWRPVQNSDRDGVGALTCLEDGRVPILDECKAKGWSAFSPRPTETDDWECEIPSRDGASGASFSYCRISDATGDAAPTCEEVFGAPVIFPRKPAGTAAANYFNCPNGELPGRGGCAASCGAGNRLVPDPLGLARCVSCGEGVGRRGKCEECPAGSAPNSDHSACIACPAGRQAAGGGRGCEACPAGSFRGAEDLEKCRPCPFGQVPNDAQSACIADGFVINPNLAGGGGDDYHAICRRAGWTAESRGPWLDEFYSVERYDICRIPFADVQASRNYEYCVMRATDSAERETDFYLAPEWPTNTHDYLDLRCDAVFDQWKTRGFPRRQGSAQRFAINCPDGRRPTSLSGHGQACSCREVKNGQCEADRLACRLRALAAGIPESQALVGRLGVEYCVKYTYGAGFDPGGECVIGAGCGEAIARSAFPCAGPSLGTRVANANNDGCEQCPGDSTGILNPAAGGECNPKFSREERCRALGGRVVGSGGIYRCLGYHQDGAGTCVLGREVGIPDDPEKTDYDPLENDSSSISCARKLPPDCATLGGVLNYEETACAPFFPVAECAGRGGALSGDFCVNFKPDGSGRCRLNTRGGRDPDGCVRAFAESLRTCGANQIVSADNLSCESCPAGLSPTPDKRNCRATATGCISEGVCRNRRVECAAREGRIIWEGGLEYCVNYEINGGGRCRIGSHGADKCKAAFNGAPAPCRAGEYSLRNGNRTECRACPAGQVPNYARTGCVADSTAAELAECEYRTGRPRSDFRRVIRGTRLDGPLAVKDALCEGYLLDGGGSCRIGVSDSQDGCASFFQAEARPCPDGHVAQGVDSCTPCPAGSVPDSSRKFCAHSSSLEIQATECAARGGRVVTQKFIAGAARYEITRHLCRDFLPDGGGECHLNSFQTNLDAACVKQFADYGRPCLSGQRWNGSACEACPSGEADAFGQTCTALTDPQTLCNQAGRTYHKFDDGKEVCFIPIRNQAAATDVRRCVIALGSGTLAANEALCDDVFPDWRTEGFPSDLGVRYRFNCPAGVTVNAARTSCSECVLPLTTPGSADGGGNLSSCPGDHAAMGALCEAAGWRWLNHGGDAARYDVCALPLRDAKTQAAPGARAVRGEVLSYCVMNRAAALDEGDADCEAAFPDWRTSGFPQSQGDDDPREFVLNCPDGASSKSFAYCAGTTADCEARGWTVANGACKGAVPGGECATGAACATAAAQADLCEAAGGAATETECAGIGGGGRCVFGADCDEVFANRASGCPPSRRLAEGRCVLASDAEVSGCAARGGRLGAGRDARGTWQAHCVLPPRRFGGARASCPLADNGCASDYIALSAPPTCRPDQALQPKNYACGCPPGTREFDLGNGPRCETPYDCSHTPLENDEANATNNGCACPYDFPYVGYYTDRCVTICSAEQEVYDGMCSPRCEEDEFRNPNGTCECRRF